MMLNDDINWGHNINNNNNDHNNDNDNNSSGNDERGMWIYVVQHIMRHFLIQILIIQHIIWNDDGMNEQDTWARDATKVLSAV